MADEVKPVNQRVLLADIAPHKRNYNRHPKSQVDRIATSLRKFGQVRSIVVWRSTILAGHGVVEAARALGWKEIAADVLPDDYPEHLALAYVAADNELGRLADPDQAALAAILEESKAQDAELLQAIGYNDAEFQALLEEVGKGQGDPGKDTEAQVDRAEELRQKWGVESGQLWQLGEHRLICGDCTDAAVVARVMGGEKAALCVTSPPYAEQRLGKYASVSAEKYVEWFALVAQNIAAHLTAKGNFCLNIKAHVEDKQMSTYVMELICYLSGGSWVLRDEFIWIHGGTPGSPNMMGKLKNQYEPIFWLSLSRNSDFYPDAVMHASTDAVLVSPRNPGLKRIQGTKNADLLAGGMKGEGLAYPGNVLKFPRGSGDVDESGNHPAVFSIALAEFFIRLFTQKQAGIVYDPFLGSGTTLIACENLGRRCRAVEISPGYVAVALERWATHTGKTPVLIE